MSSTTSEDIGLIGEFIHCISKNKLPTNKEVLKTVFYHNRHLKKDINISFSDVYNEVQLLWVRASIPTLVRTSCIKRMKKLYDDYRELQKSKSKKHFQQLQDDFKIKLDILFDISQMDVIEKLDEHSKTFLLDQHSTRNFDLCTFFKPLVTQSSKLNKKNYSI